MATETPSGVECTSERDNDENETNSGALVQQPAMDGNVSENPVYPPSNDFEGNGIVVNDEPCRGFRGAAGKMLEISAEAMAKAKALFQDVDKQESAPASIPTFHRATNGVPNEEPCMGFGGAAGKSFTVSAEAMAKAQALFQDVGEDARSHDNIPTGFHRATIDQHEDSTSNLPTSSKISAPCIGFRGAAGKMLAVSAEAMAKAQALFRDVDHELASVDRVAIDQHESSTPKQPLSSKFNDTCIGFRGAAGKMLAVSAEAMAKAQAIFQDVDKDAKSHESTPANIPTVPPSAIDQQEGSTPKLPAFSKITTSRRRLAEPTASPAFPPHRKKRCNVFNRIESSMEEVKMEKTTPTLSNFPAMASLSTRQTFFQYKTPNSKRQTPVPILFTSPAATVDEVEIKEERSVRMDEEWSDLWRDNDRSKKIEMGKLYRLREDGKGVVMNCALAGQTPRIYDWDEYERYGLKKATVDVNSANAASFKFGAEYFTNNGTDWNGGQFTLGDGVTVICSNDGISADQFLQSFVKSSIVDSSLISDDWCRNHYRWIVWKEAAMETGFPHLFGAKLLTPDRVMLQLKYRYDREVEKAERSALKRILNSDDTSNRPMVLCVSGISLNRDTDAAVEVTDGWYAVRARLDNVLSQKLVAGEVSVGQKLFISRCTLYGLEGGCEPLEVPASVQLLLTINNVRRAKWDAPLGYHRLKSVPRFPLVSLVIGGGTVAGVEIIVKQIHPIQYLVKNCKGHTVILDEKAEAKDARVFERTYELCLEKILEDMEQALGKNEMELEGQWMAKLPLSSNNENKPIPTTQEITSTTDVEDLYRMLTSSVDPESVAARTTLTQKNRLKSFCEKLNDKHAYEIRQQLERAFRKKSSTLPRRHVTPFLRMRVAGCHPKDMAKNVTPLVTVWRPDDDVRYHVKEGTAYLLTDVQVTQSSMPGDSCKFSLSTTSETRFIPLKK